MADKKKKTTQKKTAQKKKASGTTTRKADSVRSVLTGQHTRNRMKDYGL